MGHLRDNGFEVEAIDVPQLAVIRARYGISPDLAGCHTARVGGYTIEGHVPADVIRRLLSEKLDHIAGLAVPGMPLGSPGMEGPISQPYDVIAVEHNGGRSVYTRR